MGWKETVDDAVYRMLCAAFKLKPGCKKALARFIPAYLPEATTPQARRDADVCYYAVSQDVSGDSQNYQMRTIEDSVATLMETIHVNVQLVFYGPNADNDSQTFRRAFRFDSGYDSPRALLRRARIVPAGEVPRPVGLYETEGTYQRRRCDINLKLAYLEIETMSVTTIDEVPDIALSATHQH